MAEIKIGSKTWFENLLKQLFHSPLLDDVVITNSRYALVGYFITSHPTRAHGIIMIYSRKKENMKDKKSLFYSTPYSYGNPSRLIYLRFVINTRTVVNPNNLITNGPQNSGHFNRVAILKGFFKYENDRLSFCLVQNKVP